MTTVLPRPGRRRAALSLFSLLAGGYAPSAVALSFKGPLDLFPKALQTTRNVTMHPLGADKLALPSAFGLFQGGSLDLETAVARTLRGKLNPLVEMRFTDTTDGLSLTTGTSSRDAAFFVGGVPLCNFQLRAHALADRTVLMLGTVPDVDPSVRFQPADWPDRELAFEKAAAAVDKVADVAGDIALKSASRCIYVENGGLLPVWKMKVTKGGLPYEVLADAYEIQAMQQGFFDVVTGKAKVFEHNGADAAKIDFDLPGLIGDGTLTSGFLKAVLPSDGKYVKVNEPTHTYDYDNADARFIELSAYAHAQMHWDFARSIGFEWYGPAPIEIKIHTKPGGRSNNALFIPGDAGDGTLPQIQIDDGDGIDLQNLGLDGDVVSHEFGHHIVYRTLRTTDGQSLALHEGLADFFAFSRTGDPLLGETICPPESGACILPGQALRTADLGLRYKDEAWVAWAGARNRLGHLHGQLISGLLWDLRKAGEMAPADVTRLTLKAVSFFKADSGFRDLIISLFMADKELFGGRDYGILTQHINARGLGEFLSGIATVDGILPALEGGGGASVNGIVPGAPDPSAKEKKETKGDENPLRCGTIPGVDPATVALAGLLILVAPLLAALLPKPERAKARAAAKDKRQGRKDDRQP